MQQTTHQKTGLQKKSDAIHDAIHKAVGKIIVSRIRKKLYEQNKNHLHINTGGTGSGKSYTGLTLAYAINPERFSADFIAFDLDDFIEIIESAERGDVILFDEIGVAGDSRSWQNRRNKYLVYINETFRFRNLAVIYTTPSFGNVDKRIRQLFHTFSKSIGIDYDRKIAYMTFEKIVVDEWSGDIYKRPVRVFLHGFRTVTHLGFSLPPEKIVRAYEKKKERFFKDLLGKIKEGDHKNNISDFRKRVALQLRKEGFSQSKIARILGVSQQRVSQILQQAEA